MKKSYVVKNYSMPKSMVKLVEKLAKKTGMNKSEFIRAAIRHYAKYVEANGL